MKNLYHALIFVLVTNITLAQEYTLKSLGVFTAGMGDEATEILCYDTGSQRVFVVNSDLQGPDNI